MDRRKKKSRAAIFSAFLDLLKNKDFEKITINNIAEVADVSRGTVYLNFEDKYDLLDQLIKYYLKKLFLICKEVPVDDKAYFPKIIKKMFEYLDKNSDLYKSLFTEENFSKFRVLFEENLFQAFKTQAEANRRTAISDMSIHFLTTGITGTIVFWLKENKPNTPNGYATLLNNFLIDKNLLDSYIPNNSLSNF
ncbi:TetR/AcrR family transcriptional regulator [Enterococcus sp. AZ196]|uniref:TetR/AcrR family transcriptional regulator n=1 Tax=Enterococcus sp. AZ196 TaxID=2774659 RepID=UPI003D2DB927